MRAYIFGFGINLLDSIKDLKLVFEFKVEIDGGKLSSEVV